MKINYPMVIPNKPSSYRLCGVCDDDTKAVVEYTFRTGANSATSVPYCRKHADQLIDEMANFRNKHI